MSGPERGRIDWASPAPDLSAGQTEALARWAGLRRESRGDAALQALFVAGALRNATRWGEAYGLLLVAEMARRGLLRPGEDPIAALDRLLDK